MSRPPGEGLLKSLGVTERHELLSNIWEIQKVNKGSSFFFFRMIKNILED